MQPFDCLTQDDKEIVRQWCINYANAEPQSIKKILAVWNKNKKTLFRIFGKQLQISLPVHQKVNSSYRHSKWRSLYSPFVFYDKADLVNFKFDPRNHIFINNLVEWIRDELSEDIPIWMLKDIVEYTKYCYVEAGKTNEEKCFFKKDVDKALKIPKGTKIMRAIRKVLEYYSFPYMDSFNKWRDDISVINTDKEINAELVLSINPVDFITMSDNKSGWTSCMSWIDSGAYSTGTIEMLNSNVAAVAYLRNPQPFSYNGLDIPNKSWRTLVFIHKDILLVGKHYPYQSEALAKIVLDKVKEIIKNNVGWKYQYNNQLYLDMIHSYDNTYIRDYFWRLNSHHKIYVYTNIMYHDIIEDHSTEYWCCRNWVKKNLYLNLSGPATCMCCGELIDKEKTNNFSTSAKYCQDCADKYLCWGCGLVSVEHAKERIAIRQQLYSQIFVHYGNPDCFIANCLWDTKTNCCIEKSRLRNIDRNRYKILTRERLYQSYDDEICGALSA